MLVEDYNPQPGRLPRSIYRPDAGTAQRLFLQGNGETGKHQSKTRILACGQAGNLEEPTCYSIVFSVLPSRKDGGNRR